MAVAGGCCHSFDAELGSVGKTKTVEIRQSSNFREVGGSASSELLEMQSMIYDFLMNSLKVEKFERSRSEIYFTLLL